MPADPSIPRRIIQTGKSRNLPPLARAANHTFRLLHPDWEYLFFDDADVIRFIATEFPQHQRMFDSFPHRIQRYDFFRYLAVLRFGGFYFDLDVLLAEPLTELLAHPAVFAFEELTLNRFLRDTGHVDWEIGNYAFGAAAGHAFLAAVVENCVRAQRDAPWAASLVRGIPAPFRARFEVLNTTGPGLVTRTLAEQRPAAADVKILFPDDVCDSRQWHQFGKFGVHLMEASWRESGNFLGQKAALLWESWTRRRLLAQSRAIGPTRTLSMATAT
jgi:hypothetical protein